MNPMPGNIPGQSAVFVEDSEPACVVKSGRTYRGALAPWTELVEWTLTAGQEREIAGLLRPQNHGHGSADQELTRAHNFTLPLRCRLMGNPESERP